MRGFTRLLPARHVARAERGIEQATLGVAARLYRLAKVLFAPNLELCDMVLEALASGVPAVVTPSGGTKYIVEDSVTGFVIGMKGSARLWRCWQAIWLCWSAWGWPPGVRARVQLGCGIWVGLCGI